MIYRLSNVHLHLSCHVVGFPFLFLRDIPLQTRLCLKVEAMIVLHLWKQWTWSLINIPHLMRFTLSMWSQVPLLFKLRRAVAPAFTCRSRACSSSSPSFQDQGLKNGAGTIDLCQCEEGRLRPKSALNWSLIGMALQALRYWD